MTLLVVVHPCYRSSLLLFSCLNYTWTFIFVLVSIVAICQYHCTSLNCVLLLHIFIYHHLINLTWFDTFICYTIGYIWFLWSPTNLSVEVDLKFVNYLSCSLESENCLVSEIVIVKRHFLRGFSCFCWEQNVNFQFIAQIFVNALYLFFYTLYSAGIVRSRLIDAEVIIQRNIIWIS